MLAPASIWARGIDWIPARTDLGDVGAGEEREAYDPGEEVLEELRWGRHPLDDGGSHRRSVRDQSVHPEERHDLARDEEVEDEDEDERRGVAHQLDVGAAEEPREETPARSHDPHDAADDRGQHEAPDREAHGRHEPEHEQVGGERPGVFVTAEQVAGNDPPVPLVREDRVDLVCEERDDPRHHGQDDDIERLQAAFARGIRVHGQSFRATRRSR